MKHRNSLTTAFVAGLLLCALLAAPAWAATPVNRVLRQGSVGTDVVWLQRTLNLLGYDAGPADGLFGPHTAAAVAAFQEAVGLKTDALAGKRTLDALDDILTRMGDPRYIVKPGDTLSHLARRFNTSISLLAEANRLTDPDLIEEGQELRVMDLAAKPYRGLASRGAQAIPWLEVDRLFPRGGYATVTDVATLLTFGVRRRGGYLHADVEPTTAENARTLKQAHGGAWSWARRAVVVVVGGLRIAASMNGMPHGGQVIYGNAFDGHFCIHFLGSRIHRSGKVCPVHQAMVREAIGK